MRARGSGRQPSSGRRERRRAGARGGSGGVGWVAALCAALLAAASGLPAQEIRGTAREASDGQPIEGAFVSLIDERGTEITSTLTSSSGSFVLHAFERGLYRLRVERIGFETWTSEPIEAGPGATLSRTLRVPVRPVDLGELRVAVESRCSPRGTAGSELLRVWAEARKALQVTRWAEATESIRFELRRWDRILEPRHWRVQSEETRRVSKTGRASFVSLPAARLAAEGYVQRDENDAYRFYGPDADVLLSDAFLDGHCLSVVPGDEQNPDLIGLAFEPAERGDVPDVEGTLWLDPLTSELRHMEFTYTELDDVEIRGDPWAGGRVEFRRTPTGAWFVSRWWIRIPVLRQAIRPTLRRGIRGNFMSQRLSTAVEAYREIGGDVTRLRASDGEEIALGEWGTIVGRAHRPGAEAVLRGARVRLAGTEMEARTDSVGRFRLDFVPPGRYTVALEHPDPRLRGVIGASREVHVEGEEVARLTLELDPARMVDSVCPDEEAAGRGSVALLGRVIERESGAPVPDAVLWLRESGQADSRGVRADSTGSFLVCGVEDYGTLEVVAAARGRTGERRRLEVPEGGLLLRDFEVAPVTVAEAFEDAVDGSVLRGVVKSAETGEPVSGARVRVLGTDLERLTGRDGTFVIPDVPGGSRQVVTEYLGMTSDTARVELAGGTVSLAVLTLETEPVPLPALHVEVERTVGNLRLAGFYERMDRGLGEFIDREDLEARDVVANMRRVPGVRVGQCLRTPGSRSVGEQQGASQTREGQRARTAPSTRLRMANCWEIEIGRQWALRPDDRCAPLVFVDGRPVGGITDQFLAEFTGENPFNLLQQMPRDMLEGIEVHRNAATAPAQYRGFGAGCGVILVWTRGHGS